MQKNYKVRIKTSLINSFMREIDLNKREFCKKAGVSHSALKKIYNNNFDFDIVYLYRICKILKAEFREMFIEK